MEVRVRRKIVGPYDNTTYVLVCAETEASLIVDCPLPNEQAIVEQATGTAVAGILLTHGHGDHLASLAEVKRHFNVPVHMHPDDYWLLDAEKRKLIDVELAEGHRIPWGSCSTTVLHTPGHTPGSVCFRLNGDLISGDTLFPGGPGNTRSVEDFRRIVKSVTERLYVLPDGVVVWPGHGQETTIGASKEEYKLYEKRGKPDNLRGDVTWAG
jgi:glyoxylase-like metal-dependent hydrolase (beta-lactamase superfamily II)